MGRTYSEEEYGFFADHPVFVGVHGGDDVEEIVLDIGAVVAFHEAPQDFLGVDFNFLIEMVGEWECTLFSKTVMRACLT